MLTHTTGDQCQLGLTSSHTTCFYRRGRIVGQLNLREWKFAMPILARWPGCRTSISIRDQAIRFPRVSLMVYHSLFEFVFGRLVLVFGQLFCAPAQPCASSPVYAVMISPSTGVWPGLSWQSGIPLVRHGVFLFKL